MVLSFILFPFTFTIVIAFGCNMFFTCFFMLFNIINNRETLIPPPVDPAHAPITIRHNNIVLDSSGHRL